MKSYRGERTFDGVVVTTNGTPLGARHDLKLLSQNSFEWGYEGAESSQLALAILADAVDDQTALQWFDAFMRTIVANFSNEWEISQEQVRAALADLQQLQN